MISIGAESFKLDDVFLDQMELFAESAEHTVKCGDGLKSNIFNFDDSSIK